MKRTSDAARAAKTGSERQGEDARCDMRKEETMKRGGGWSENGRKGKRKKKKQRKGAREVKLGMRQPKHTILMMSRAICKCPSKNTVLSSKSECQNQWF